ncbi:hypothetical protein CGGC5_v007181 [Colletotrichum fructicola Nara gc5]|uniref:Uncharacterized protein n=1 Tax=Colletotrichum fructicola (strain Nara gc5) TaxID=1213859 RepID=A0A7J6J5M6_COLFN|nr:hypothetical protein CGGC5_v007181 [Colletotrichum fructicola Nara gc5]
MEIRNEWNDGILVVSCNWVNQDGRDIEAYDDLLACTDNRALKEIRTRPPGQLPFSKQRVRWMRKCMNKME